MEAVAVTNQKGGVGKTTVVINLAAALAREGQRVLVVDMDFQANATAALTHRVEAASKSVAHVLVGAARMDEVLVETTTPGLTLAPATEDLARADLTLSSRIGRETALRRALVPVVDRFDVALIDTSPYLGLLTVNALVAARHVLVPVSAEYFPMLGLQLLNDTIADVRSQMESPLDVLGYLVTMYDRRLGVTAEVLELIEQRFGALVLENKVRVNANLKAAPAHRKDIFQFEAETKKPWKGTEDFTGLAREVLTRLKKSASQEAAA
jgi:chromosome partitioning protein